MLFKTGSEDQSVFRTILQAVSHPGRIFVLPEASDRRKKWASLLKLLTAVMDGEITHHIVDGALCPDFSDLLYAATKSPAVALESADFVIVPGGDTKGSITSAKRGTPEYPDMAATIVYGVRFIAAGEAQDDGIFLQGPGIHGRIALPVMDGLNSNDLRLLFEINNDFPLGVDTLFVDEAGRVVAIPRSTRMTD